PRRRRRCSGSSQYCGAARLRRRDLAGRFAAFRSGDPERPAARMGPEPQWTTRRALERAAAARAGWHGDAAGAAGTRHRARSVRSRALPDGIIGGRGSRRLVHQIDDRQRFQIMPLEIGKSRERLAVVDDDELVLDAYETVIAQLA